MKKSQLVSGDKPLTKLFTDSAKSTVYKLPTKYVDGTYTGCKTCSTGKNHGGAPGKKKKTTKPKPSKKATKKEEKPKEQGTWGGKPEGGEEEY